MDVKELVINDRSLFFYILRYLKLNDRYHICITSSILYYYFKQFPHSNFDKNIINITRLFIQNKKKTYELCKTWKGKINYHANISNKYEINNFKMLSEFYSLDILNYYRLDFNIFKIFNNIHVLNLSGCMYIENLYIPETVHTLNLSYTKIKDVSLLANIHTIDLSYCRELEDISPLKNVYNLNLCFCLNIKDVSPLCNVHTLDLSYCHITSLSPSLSPSLLPYNNIKWNCHKLNLTCCRRLIDISSLRNCNIHTLNLSCLNNLNDISMLSNIDTLNISWCTKITDISTLRNIKNVISSAYDNLCIMSIPKNINLTLLN